MVNNKTLYIGVYDGSVKNICTVENNSIKSLYDAGDIILPKIPEELEHLILTALGYYYNRNHNEVERAEQAVIEYFKNYTHIITCEDGIFSVFK